MNPIPNAEGITAADVPSNGGTRRLPPGVRALYPFAGQQLRLTSGHRLHYLDEGAGPPLLMLHGNPTWSFYYRELVLALRDRYRCVVPDHLGCGLSDKPPGWRYRIADHRDNICELVTALDLQDATLVVHDWGGPIGYLAALEHPERFRRFVVFNSTVFLMPLPRALTALRIPGYGSLVIQGLNGLLRAGLWTSVVHRRRFTRDVRAGYLFPYDSWAHRKAIRRFVEEIPVEPHHPNRQLLGDLGQRLHEFAGRPHIVIWGLRDRVFHPGYLDGWRERFPSAEVHALTDASHWVVDEAPERVVALVSDFLARTEAGERP
jgi:pimeloyl-ACP methyl ester carboxylesterase